MTPTLGSNSLKAIYLIANITDEYDMSGEEFTWTCHNQKGQQIPVNKKLRMSETADYVFIVVGGALEGGQEYTFTASSKFTE